MRKRLSLITLTICVAFTVFAQLPDTLSYAISPTAGSLGQYGEIPVSPFTGVPLIEIPIYEFTVDGQRFPISLSYHTSGIRVEQKPSWVGHGWTLNAGGCIIRKQNGGPDEVLGTSQYAVQTSQGYFHNMSLLSAANWDTESFIDNYLSVTHNWSLQDRNDTEPDEFIFSLPGCSGSFLRDHLGNWTVKSSTPVKVEGMTIGAIPFNTPIDHTDVILGFTLATSDGIKYRFGYDTDAVEYSIPYLNQRQSYWTSTCWQLVEILYPSGNKVRLHYTRGDFTSQIWYDHSIRTVQYDGYSAPKILHWRDNATKMGVLITPVYLSQIEFPLGVVSFSTKQKERLEHTSVNDSESGSTVYYLVHGLYGQLYPHHGLTNGKWPIRSWALDSLTVYDNESNKIQRTIFNYGSATDKRLKLNSMYTRDPENTDRAYVFSYYNWDNLPRYNSDMMDHWGYYNATQWDYVNDNKRNPGYLDIAATGVLTRIKYPTGGYTRFEYQSHQCSKILNKTHDCLDNITRTVGGVRIKRIINSPTGNKGDEIVSREYFYINGYASLHGDTVASSSGVLAGWPQYRVNDYRLECCKQSGFYGTFNFDCMDHSAFSGGTNGMGSHIGYSEVAEKFPDGSFKVYKFSNFDNGYTDSPACACYHGTRTEHMKYSSREQDRGLLLSEEEYGNDYVLRSKKTFAYQTDSAQFVRAMHVNFLDMVQNKPFVEAATYKIFTYMPQLVQETETRFFDGQPIKRAKHFTYNNYGQIETMSESANNGDSIVTHFDYLWQRSPQALSEFVLSPVASETKSYEYADSSPSLLLRQTFSTFSRYGNRLWRPVAIIVGHSSSGEACDTTELVYTAGGQLVQTTRNHTDNTVYLWSHSGQFLAGVIRNANYAEVNYALFEIEGFILDNFFEDFPDDGQWELMNSLRQNLPKAQVTLYRYRPLWGMTGMLSPDGKQVSYEYDRFGRLKAVLDNKRQYVELYKYHRKDD